MSKFGMSKSRLPAVNKQIQESEDSILQLGQVLTERVYERYASGEITSEQMQKIYQMLAKWTKLSEKLLNSVTEHSPNDFGKIQR